MYETRVLSGMRPTGSLHLGHYHGVLRNWIRLQAEYTCLFFVADWHALTTKFEETEGIAASTREMVADWLAVGLDPERSVIFRQSALLEHAELFLIFAMITPTPWLLRTFSWAWPGTAVSARTTHERSSMRLIAG